MAWTLLQPAFAVKKTRIGLRFTIVTTGTPMLVITIPSAISGGLGFDAEGVEHGNVFIGSDAMAGKMLVVPARDGASKLKRLKHCLVIMVPPPAGLVLREESAEVDYVAQDSGNSHNGFVVDLPAWAVPGGDGSVAPSKLAAEKPGGLDLNGTTLVLGGREVKLTATQAALVARLNDDFGRCVTRRALWDHLYALDPDGGAEEKIIDVQICKIRALLKGWPITIVTHWGKGFELRRAVT